MTLKSRLTRLEAINVPDQNKITVFCWGTPEHGTSYASVIGHKSQGHHRRDFPSDRAFTDAVDAEHIEAHGRPVDWGEARLFDDGSKHVQPESTIRDGTYR